MGTPSKLEKNSPSESKSELWLALRNGSIGLEMGLSVAVGYGIGWWLDDRFDTYPWWTGFWTLVGITAAFRALLLLKRRVERIMGEDISDDPKGSEERSAHNENGDDE